MQGTVGKSTLIIDNKSVRSRKIDPKEVRHSTIKPGDRVWIVHSQWDNFMVDCSQTPSRASSGDRSGSFAPQDLHSYLRRGFRPGLKQKSEPKKERIVANQQSRQAVLLLALFLCPAFYFGWQEISWRRIEGEVQSVMPSCIHFYAAKHGRQKTVRDLASLTVFPPAEVGCDDAPAAERLKKLGYNAIAKIWRVRIMYADSGGAAHVLNQQFSDDKLPLGLADGAVKSLPIAHSRFQPDSARLVGKLRTNRIAAILFAIAGVFIAYVQIAKSQ
jgi:hypothetical protein